MGLNHSPSIVTSGLVMCLDAGNTKSYPGSGTTWVDLSRRNNNGTLTNSPTFATTNGGIINYSGSATVSTPIVLGASYTMSCWFRLTAVSTGTYQAILGVYQSNYMCLIMNATDAFMGLWTETASAQALGSSAVSTNTWYNYTLAREGDNNGTGYKLYVNGLYTGAWHTGTRPTTDFFHVGGRPDTTQPPSGGIANSMVYNRALSATEILQNVNALRGRFGI